MRDLFNAPQVLTQSRQNDFALFAARHFRAKQLALVTGAPGIGKSVTLRLLTERLAAQRDVKIGILSRPQAGRTTILVYVIGLVGLLMIVFGVADIFTREATRARLRVYGMAIAMISGGLALGGLAQALRLLLAIHGRPL